MKTFIVYRNFDAYTCNRCFFVNADNEDQAISKIVDYLNNFYYDSVDGTVNGGKPYAAKEFWCVSSDELFNRQDGIYVLG